MEVTKAHFFEAIGRLNVHPRIVGPYPYTSIFETPGRTERGRIVGEWGVKPATTTNRYFLQAGD